MPWKGEKLEIYFSTNFELASEPSWMEISAQSRSICRNFPWTFSSLNFHERRPKAASHRPKFAEILFGMFRHFHREPSWSLSSPSSFQSQQLFLRWRRSSCRECHRWTLRVCLWQYFHWAGRLCGQSEWLRRIASIQKILGNNKMRLTFVSTFINSLQWEGTKNVFWASLKLFCYRLKKHLFENNFVCFRTDAIILLDWGKQIFGLKTVMSVILFRLGYFVSQSFTQNFP